MPKRPSSIKGQQTIAFQKKIKKAEHDSPGSVQPVAAAEDSFTFGSPGPSAASSAEPTSKPEPKTSPTTVSKKTNVLTETKA